MPDNGPMDHVRALSDVAFRLTHSGSPALRPFHGLWPRLGCRSPLAARRCRAAFAAPTPLGWAASADVYFSFGRKRCWRRSGVSLCLRHFVAYRSSLTGTRVYYALLHTSWSLVVASLEQILPLHWMVWRAGAAPGRTRGQC